MSASLSRLGSLLEITPLLTMDEGQLVPIEKVARNHEQLIDVMSTHVLEFMHPQEIGILHHGLPEVAAGLKNRLVQELPAHRLRMLPYPPGLAAVLGPELVGVMVIEGSQ